MSGSNFQHQLDQLRTDCEHLLDTATTPDDFVGSLLPLTTHMGGVRAAALWLRDENSRMRLVREHQLASLAATDRMALATEHQNLIQQTLADGRTRVVPERDPADTGLQPHALVLAGIRKQDQGVGVIELYADPSPTAEQTTHLRHAVELLAAFASRFFEDGPAQHQTAPNALFWERFERFVLQLQRSLDLTEVAAIASNDARFLLGCDRVSLAARHGPQARVLSISGQDEVQLRSNQVQAMSRLADQVMQGGVPVTYRGTLESFPPLLEGPLSDYLVESRARMVRLLPLFESEPVARTDHDHPSGDEQKPRAVIGCLVVEQMADSRPKPGLLDKADLLADHVAAAIGNARRHESIFLLPLWRSLGRGLAWFRGRNLWITLAVLGGIGVMSAALALIPWEYRIEATGLAMPVSRRGVFSPRDADVEQVLVASNQRVTAGTPLLRLKSAELDERATQLSGEIARLEKEAYKLRRDQDEARRKGDRDQEQQAYTQYRQIQSDKAAKQEELAIVETERGRLRVVAPEAGVVATFRLEELLRGRPVQRGEMLLEIMDETGDWRLELEVPEYRMGHLLRAQQESQNHRLDIDYTPATDSRLDLHAELTDIATRSNESEDEGTIVQVYADIDPDDLPGRRIGAEVDAHIRCGQRSLFYCLFGDVVEFVQRNVWW
ncbi:MAG: HlyD family efflux transporter periplasmic adaptor subunit [Planctomycetaceae bacterium]